MKRIIIEAEKCDGCKSCSLACMQAHRKDSGDIYTLDLNDINNESRNFIYKQSDGSYRPIFCRHCDEPECVISCMSFMCVMNCPYGVLKPDDATKSVVIKCDFCKDLGGEPSCVKACPKQAIHVEEV